MPKITGIFSVLLLNLAMTACAGNSALPELTLSGPETHYTLGAGDKLRITVYGEDKLTGEYLVDGSGAIAFPLIGAVPAKGLTAPALADRIAAGLSKGYLDNPSVAIDVLNLRPYYILGEVNKPGEYQFAEGLTVFSAVAKAEGFTYRADEKRVYIRHKDGVSEVLYRLDGITPVQPGDTIRVLERRF
ncbi:polysaccharide biosynthesis/export family protein [Novosphingobium guangzhouense]|uniref:Polysaccharide biosynthesis protein n=1 Tax=Novosphingobium guangzhouense TaxID=1850347 RepID=A0A2K2G3R3_9SPHN|nr:polysaccharide biosynthesis/export family protein [Novosphingobium guangzhouense]PNU05642.1 polysaccharide biosynthesis protein [Novosphingobium guangzhouense]